MREGRLGSRMREGRLGLSRSYSDGVGLIRTVGTTDMPGPSATSVGVLSMMSLTGTRWTILT